MDAGGGGWTEGRLKITSLIVSDMYASCTGCIRARRQNLTVLITCKAFKGSTFKAFKTDPLPFCVVSLHHPLTTHAKPKGFPECRT
ncbi:hypothetical protein CEXT_751541 [Caerostris extrusa]|uniref:Uncharacterized protein n=1 Tax=Caerostris extrusa TaxID=172846 RepID=A0AAV4NQT3_CAEEX|nr:hypothetical protein CEXT_751541 [Caerostris extrusa]